MKKSTKILLFILCVALVAFAVWFYCLLAGQLVKNKQELAQSKGQIRQLEGELAATQEQLQQVRAELEGTLAALKEVNDKLARTQQDNLALLEEKDKLEAKLRSLQELKKAIKEVKIERRQQKKQEYLAKKETQKEIDVQKLAQGNRGFLIKGGQSTHQPRVTIDVQPTY
jgi:chromosome segregation ATPase